MKLFAALTLFLIVVFSVLPQENDGVREQASQILEQASKLQREGKYAEAVSLLLENEELFNSTGQSERAGALNNLGNSYRELGDNTKAEPLLLEAKAIYEQAGYKEHPDYATVLFNLGTLYTTLGDYAKAESYFLESKDIYEQLYGREHPDYAGVLNELGTLYAILEDYAKAEPYFLEAKAIYEQAGYKEHPDYATVLFNLGVFYSTLEDYAKAESYSLEAKDIYEQLYGREHPDYAGILRGLGTLYTTIGDYAKTESYFLEAKDIYEQLYGREHFGYALSLGRLGILYSTLGDYAKAESYYLESKDIYEQLYGREHSNNVALLHNLGILYSTLGDYAKAESYYLESKDIYEQLYGREHSAYANSLNSLGLLYQKSGDYAKAESFLLESKVIRERVHGREHPTYANSLHNLGHLYEEFGDYAKAETLLLESKAVFELVFGMESAAYALSSNSLGNFYRVLGDYDKAETLLLKSKTIREQLLGREHKNYAITINNLGLLYKDMGDYISAEASFRELSELSARLVTRNFSFLSERQRGLYFKTVSNYFETGYSLSQLHPVSSVNGLNYNNTLLTKGLLLRTTNAVRDGIYSSGDAVLIEQFEQMGGLRQQISQLWQRDNADQAYLRSLEERADSLDKSLTQASAAFRDLKADMTMQWQDVQSHLQPGEVALEFVSFSGTYAVLLLRPESEAPVWVPLCGEGELQGLLGRVDGMASNLQARVLYDRYGLDLYSAIWKPLEQELGGIETIYYSPSGLLHKIAFNALPVEDNVYERLADKYNLILVSSTREIARLGVSRADAARLNSAVLYGGLDYNADETDMRLAAQTYKTEEPRAAVASLPPAGVTRGGAWIALPATREEVLHIQRHLDNQKIPNELLMDTRGNEESFKQLDGAKVGLIHLATHGFFLNDIERRNNEGAEQLGGIVKASENPLLRSGLLLAGGNHAWLNNPVEGVESGILTADKIAGMNLLGAQLIVLSACQTGLGDVNNSEGVFGLQRAFKLAGAETLMMSLWEVDDAATEKLMDTFYREWLFSGKSKQEAFREAQRQIRSEYPAPYYWAGFVLMD